MRLFIIILCLLFPVAVHAEWRLVGNNPTKKVPNTTDPYYYGGFVNDRFGGHYDLYFWYGSTKGAIDPTPNGEQIYNYRYTDADCQAQYSKGMVSVNVPSGTLVSANDYVNTGSCNLYQTPGVTFCTNNPDDTQTCTTNWKAESNGGFVYPGSDATFVDESSFQLTDDPSSCSHGSYSSGGKSYCYTGQSTDINTISIGDDGQPDNGGTDNGDSGAGGSDSSGGASDTGGDTGSDDTGSGSGSTGGGSGGSGGGGSGGSSGGTGGGSGGGTDAGTGGDSGSGAGSGTGSGTDSGSGATGGDSSGAGSGAGDGDGEGDDDEQLGDAPQSTRTISEINGQFMNRLRSSPIVRDAAISFPSGGGLSSCPTPTIQFDVLGHHVSQTLDMHCAVIEQYSGMFSALFLFLWGFFAFRVFMSA